MRRGHAGHGVPGAGVRNPNAAGAAVRSGGAAAPPWGDRRHRRAGRGGSAPPVARCDLAQGACGRRPSAPRPGRTTRRPMPSTDKRKYASDAPDPTAAGFLPATTDSPRPAPRPPERAPRSLSGVEKVPDRLLLRRRQPAEAGVDFQVLLHRLRLVGGCRPPGRLHVQEHPQAERSLRLRGIDLLENLTPDGMNAGQVAGQVERERPASRRGPGVGQGLRRGLDPELVTRARSRPRPPASRRRPEPTTPGARRRPSASPAAPKAGRGKPGLSVGP